VLPGNSVDRGALKSEGQRKVLIGVATAFLTAVEWEARDVFAFRTGPMTAPKALSSM
jgi:hypothetical protein